MSYKTILVHLDGSKRATEQLKLAANLAIKFDAHLIGAAVTGISAETYMPDTMGGEGLYLSSALDYLRDHAKLNLATFEATARSMGVQSFEKRVVDDEAGAGLSLHARYCDLAVIGQVNLDALPPYLRADFPEYVLMNSGCPVLIVPYTGQFDHVAKKVLVAWDASIEASRSVAAAIPLMQKADIVHLVVYKTAHEVGVHGQQPGADIALRLARHGVNVEVSQQTLPSDIDIGNALLSHAADIGADLIVMGGYGHSRFREVILGGVTHTILNSMTIPVFMCH